MDCYVLLWTIMFQDGLFCIFVIVVVLIMCNCGYFILKCPLPVNHVIVLIFVTYNLG